MLVLHLKLRWEEAIMAAPSGAKVVKNGDRWDLLLKVGPNVSSLGLALTPGGTPRTGNQPVWVLEKLGPTVYAVNPSVVSNDIAIQHEGRAYPLHAYVVIYDCPEGLNGYPEPARPPA